MSITREINRQKRIFYGWWIVLAGCLMVPLGTAAQWYPTMAFNKLAVEFGVHVTLLMPAWSYLAMAAPVVCLPAGPLIDRFGPRIPMVVGVIIAAVGYFFMGFVKDPSLFVFGGLILGTGIGLGFVLPVQTAAANWFVKRRSLALAIVSLPSAVVLPLSDLTGGANIADQIGAQGSFLVMAVLIIAFGIPLALLMRQRPEQYGLLPDGVVVSAESEKPEDEKTTWREIGKTLKWALRTRSFWLLVAALLLSIAIYQLATPNTVTYLMKHNLPLTTTSPARGIIPFLAPIGIVLFGFLGDYFPKRYLLALVACIRSASILILLTASDFTQVQVYYVVSGIAVTTPLFLAIRADYFGRRAFATILVAFNIIGMPIGILMVPLFTSDLFRWFQNGTSTPESALIVAMLLGLIPALLFFFAKPPKAVEQHQR